MEDVAFGAGGVLAGVAAEPPTQRQRRDSAPVTRCRQADNRGVSRETDGDGLILDDLPAKAIDALLFLTGPGVQSPLLVVDLRHLGGAVSRPDPDGGAVSHLLGRFLAFAVGIAPTPRAAQAVEQAIGALAPWTIDRDYPNMREAAVPAARFYPPRTLSRLLAVQAAYDPDHVIRASHPLGG